MILIDNTCIMLVITKSLVFNINTIESECYYISEIIYYKLNTKQIF
jgi:hypothetical protein